MKTIDVVIEQCEEIANASKQHTLHMTHFSQSYDEWAEEWTQISEWLKELKAYKEQGGDAISRKHLLEEIAMLKKSPWFNENTYGSKVIRKEAVEIVEDVCIKREPSVTPQPRTGRWIADVDKWGEIVTTVNGFRCSECNTFNTDKDNYCPNCGAKMEVEDAD